jgi:hypothetical protein
MATNYGLNIRDSAAMDIVCLGALVQRLDPGIIPFPQGESVPDSRQRRGIQCGRQPLRLLRPSNGDCYCDSQISRRRSGRRKSPGHGGETVLPNVEDLQKGLGIAGPEMAAKSKLDPSAFPGIIDRVLERYPHIKIIATTLPEVHSTNRHGWAAVSWINGGTYTSPQCELDVHDRVGGGDGFVSGFSMVS